MRYTLLLLIALVGFATVVQGDPLQHEVRQGETLYGIARRYGLSVRELTELNRIDSPDLVLPGTILTVGSWYQVQRGDTLFGIARTFETTVDQLRHLNDLSDSTIRIGQRLRIPSPEPVTIASRETGSEGTTGAAAGPRESREPTSTEPASTEPTTEPVAVPVAVSVERPITFADGGAWPVAGRRTTLQGKLPGVMIRSDRGTPVVAISSGRVVYAGPHSSFGNVVFVQSGQGYIYVYGGQEQILVDVGDVVGAGNILGAVGISPSEGEGALYFSVWRDNQFVDPATAPRG